MMEQVIVRTLTTEVIVVHTIYLFGFDKHDGVCFSLDPPGSASVKATAAECDDSLTLMQTSEASPVFAGILAPTYREPHVALGTDAELVSMSAIAFAEGWNFHACLPTSGVRRVVPYKVRRDILRHPNLLILMRGLRNVMSESGGISADRFRGHLLGMMTVGFGEAWNSANVG